jgi:DNA-binding helix-hairpin-helix protein with protein kinase domain
MPYFDSQRRPIVLGPELARGGEAVVYRVQGQADRLAKIYTPPRPAYADKLARMAANPPADPCQTIGHASIAWPAALLYDGRSQFAGYLMPFIQQTAPLLEVFNPRRRAQILPDFDGRYLHRAARNLAAALAALHAKSYVAGDLNESNVLVTPAALVSLIDCDSFQVREQREAQIIFYPCPVGKPEYTPPELQGQPFRDVVRLPEHDRFGLAVLIFQLLMEGSHPFRGRWLAAGDPPPLEEKIRQGWFPYAVPAPGPVAPPPNRPTLDPLHPRLAGLAQRCFVDGHANPRLRPMPEEWLQALGEAEQSLALCPNGHYYGGHLAQCPHCGAGRSAGQIPLIPVISKPAPPPRPAAPPLRPAAPPPALPATVPCRRCGHVNAATEVYCQQCTHTLGVTQSCPHCAASVPRLTPYCPRCGRVIAATAVPCPHCGRRNAVSEIYCQGCVQPLTGSHACVACGRAAPQNGRYCPNCGQKM